MQPIEAVMCMKTILKKILFPILVLNIFIGNNFLFSSILEVYANDSNTIIEGNIEDNTIYLGMNENTSEVLTLTNDSDYEFYNCTGVHGIASTTYDSTSCTVSAEGYGMGIITITLYNKTTTELSYVNYYVNVDMDEYMSMLLNKIPDVIDNTKAYENFTSYASKFLPSGISANREYNCEINTDNYICPVKISYGYGVFGEYKEISKTKNVVFKRPIIEVSYDGISLDKNDTYSLYLTNFAGNYDDLIWVSENNNIATVSQTGIVTGVSAGNTNVKVYDKNTLEYDTVNVLVYGGEYDIDKFLEKFKGTVEIDVSNINNYYSPGYLNSTVYSYFSKQFQQSMTSTYWIGSVSNINEICTDNVCKVKFTYYDGMNYIEKETEEFTVLLKGLYVEYSSLYLGEEFELKYNKLNLDSDEVIINYDPLYLEKTESGKFIPLKVGETTVELISTSGYTTSYTFAISYTYDENVIFNNYLTTIKTIELPYSVNDFSTSTGYRYLDSVVKEKIINEYPTEEVRQYLDAKVICYKSDSCFINLNAKFNNSFLINYSDSFTSKITYKETNTETISKLKTFVEPIEDYYAISFDDTIKLENTCAGDSDCFYGKLIDHSGLLDLIDSDYFDTELRKINTYRFLDDVKGGINYKLIVKYQDTVLYTKEITIMSNHIISMASDLEDSNENKLSYVKGYIDNLLTANSNVVHLRDKIYQVSVSGINFNVVLDKKDKVKITSVDVTNRLFELKVGETKKILYNVYPTGANTGNVEFEVEDQNIVSVDSKGNITALNKGYTYIVVKYSGTATKLLVTVDTDPKEVLNGYLEEIDPNIVVTYSDLKYNPSLEYAISNVVSSKFYSGNSWLPLNIETVKENNEYYIRVVYQYNYSTSQCVKSDLKKINYQIKGISFEKNIYDLKVGETVNTKLSFTEGDNYNLYFDYSDPTVALMLHNGYVTGLKPGVITIYVNDKFNQYYNYIKVRVDYENYYNKVIEELNNNPIEINYLRSGIHDYDLENEFNNKLEEYLDVYEIGVAVDTTCDIEKSTCTIKTYNGENPEEIYMTETLPVKFVGIELEEKEIELDLNEEYELSYQIHNDDVNSLTITLLDEEVCSLNDNKVTGLKPGACTIKYQTNKYVNYQHFMVDSDNYVKLFKTMLDDLSSSMILPLEPYDEAHSKDDYMYQGTYYFTIDKTIRNAINSDLEYYITFEFDKLLNDDSLEVYLVPNYIFQDSKNSYYYNHNFESTDSKKIEFTYKGIPDEELELGSKLNDKIKSRYELNLIQYLRYRLEKKEFGLMEYSSFVNDLESICSDCTFQMTGGGGMASSFHIEEGGDYIIYHNEYPIFTKTMSVMVNFEVIQMGAILSESEYVEIIKKEIKDAYLEAKRTMELRNIVSGNLYGLRNLVNDDDVEVLVEKEFDESIMKNVYTFTVEDISFTTAINNKVEGEISYSISVLEVNVDKDDITLEIGQEDTINVEINPTNATNKNVTWTSSDSSIVSVNDGKIKGLKEGVATITVTTVDRNLEKEITVTVVGNSNGLGDINEDKSVNMADLIQLRKYVAGINDLSSKGLTNADINKDGLVNITDIIKLRKYLAGLENF